MGWFFLTSSFCRKSFLQNVYFAGRNMTSGVDTTFCTASKPSTRENVSACFYALQRLTRRELMDQNCLASTARRFVTQNNGVSLNNALSSCTVARLGSCIGRTRFHSGAVGRAVSTAVSKDVVLFEHDKRTFFRLLGFFCAGQFLFWISLAHFAFTSLKDTGYRETVITDDAGRNLPKLGGVSLNLGSTKWRYGFTVSCLTVGTVILVAGSAFARRSVSRILLHRGGQEVTFTTYYPFGGTSSFSAPLRHVSCVAHRAEVPSMIPVRVKGHALYFLLDKQGRFHNTRLFDVTVGAYRKL
ncbi:transmembrane protein 223-like [Acipenser oxyrinchus oxyrinchus]|uniref:Transmembrane protein 223-like n=1 Tax=Acipenser oxyrinchus oxyrinchus TaxID=40147 RepID=A0AAD8FWZ8_ACIOX|nr:transmembrane protein 223-like [Acipenser oxyrinchus oxyrinchus]